MAFYYLSRTPDEKLLKNDTALNAQLKTDTHEFEFGRGPQPSKAEESIQIKTSVEKPVVEHYPIKAETISQPLPSEPETQYKKLLVRPFIDNKNNWNQLNPKKYKQKVLIQPGDFILKIAKKEFGTDSDMMIDLIHMANPEIKNINKVFKNQKITLPIIESEDLIVKNPGGNYHIHYFSSYSYLKARKIVEKLSGQDHKVFLLPVKMGDNLVFRIYVGLFESKTDASNYMGKLDFRHLPFLVGLN